MAAVASPKSMESKWTLATLDEAPAAFYATNPIFTRDYRSGDTTPVIHVALKYADGDQTTVVTLAYASRDALERLYTGENLRLDRTSWAQPPDGKTLTLVRGGFEDGMILSLGGGEDFRTLILRLALSWDALPPPPLNEEDEAWDALNDSFVLMDLGPGVVHTRTVGDITAELRATSITLRVGGLSLALAVDVFEVQELQEFVREWCAGADDPRTGLDIAGSWSRAHIEMSAPSTLGATDDRAKLLIHDGPCGGTLRVYTDYGMVRDALAGLFA